MSTLAEIESAIDRLPPGQQEQLLQHLSATVRRRQAVMSPTVTDQWMQRLDILRASIDSGVHPLSSEQILTETREGRY